ncbi:hypothetical protein JOB18_038886 [Solea senegalensis]|uniref:Uncharacterized protein n=1 Tax=Solea senegalensis TaxID=28829 RepID=A0AAV6QKC6_SOLSE|nr:hypothetical protein JOB18_038886 [Solea senegalensis]
MVKGRLFSVSEYKRKIITQNSSQPKNFLSSSHRRALKNPRAFPPCKTNKQTDRTKTKSCNSRLKSGDF